MLIPALLINLGRVGNFEDLFASKPIAVSDVPLALYSGLFSYMGWWAEYLVNKTAVFVKIAKMNVETLDLGNVCLNVVCLSC